MAKIKENKRIQKLRDEVTMRRALQDLIDGKAQRCIPPQDDDSDIIILDVIEELLEKRGIVERIRNFVVTMNAEMARR
jgi:hypothetical protein